MKLKDSSKTRRKKNYQISIKSEGKKDNAIRHYGKKEWDGKHKRKNKWMKNVEIEKEWGENGMRGETKRQKNAIQEYKRRKRRERYLEDYKGDMIYVINEFRYINVIDRCCFVRLSPLAFTIISLLFPTPTIFRIFSRTFWNHQVR